MSLQRTKDGALPAVGDRIVGPRGGEYQIHQAPHYSDLHGEDVIELCRGTLVKVPCGYVRASQVLWDTDDLCWRY